VESSSDDQAPMGAGGLNAGRGEE